MILWPYDKFDTGGFCDVRFTLRASVARSVRQEYPVLPAPCENPKEDPAAKLSAP